ncbi:MAG TPA: hypothetical protein VMB72_03110, partial [Acidimicrobiales bacterium]|nr:hypothetical protein [Acidimicrobiales bacterium]
FVGAGLVNAACALLVLWAVRRRAGPRCALWAAACLGLLGLALATTGPGLEFLEQPLGALVSPWNPYVVILPLVLCTVLCAAGATGSTLSLVGALLVGSVVVQSDVSTAPLVVVLVAVSGAIAAARALRRRRSPGAATGPAPTATVVGAVLGVALLVVLWLPPLVQEVTGSPGNLTLLARFFTARHPTQALRTGLWSVLAVDGALVRGQRALPFVLGRAPAGAGIVLVATLGVGVAAVVVGIRRRSPFAVALGAAGLAGLVVGVASATRVVGTVFAYLVLWEVAAPLSSLVGLGVALGSPAPQGAHRLRGERRRRGVTAALVVLVLGLTAACSVRMATLPAPGHASDPGVVAAWHDVAGRLRPGRAPVYVNCTGGGVRREQVFIGLVAVLELHGYHPRVNAFWLPVFGPGYLARGRPPTSIVLAPAGPGRPPPAAVGSFEGTDVLISRTP